MSMAFFVTDGPTGWNGELNRNPRQNAGASDTKNAKFYMSLCPSRLRGEAFFPLGVAGGGV